MRGQVAVTGELALAPGSAWDLAITAGCDPLAPVGTTIATGGMPPGSDGTLTSWDSTGWTDGPYRLTLSAEGSASHRCVIVDNTGPLALLAGGVVGPADALLGTVDDANPAAYLVEVAPGGVATSAWQELGWTTVGSSITDGPLADLEWITSSGSPLSGMVGIRLTVVDAAGNSAVATRDVYVETGPIPDRSGASSVVIPPGWVTHLFPDQDVLVERTLFSIPVAGPDHAVVLRHRDSAPARRSPLGAWSTGYTQSLTLGDGIIVWHAPDAMDRPFVEDGGRWVGAPDGAAWLERVEDGTLRLTRPDEDTLVFEGAAPGRLLRIVDATGRGLSLDWQPDIVTVTDDVGRATTLVIDPTGLVRSITDPAGRAWTFDHTDDGSLASVIDPLGGVTLLTMDGPRLVGITPVRGTGADAEPLAWRIAHDRGAPRLIGPDGTEAAPDQQAPIVGPWAPDDPRPAVPDPLAAVAEPGARVERDADGRPLTATTDAPSGSDAPDAITRFVYDEDRDGIAGLVATVIDPTGRRTRYAYDALGRVTRSTIPMRGGQDAVTTYRYDKLGSLIAVIDPLGIVTRYATDARGWVVTRIEACADPGGSAPEACEGSGPAAADQNVITRFRYDRAGRVVARVLRSASGDLRTEWSYDDARGTVERVTDPGGLDLRHAWALDPDGRVVAERDGRGSVTVHRWGPDGRVVETIDGCLDPGSGSGADWATCSGDGAQDGTHNVVRRRDAAKGSPGHLLDEEVRDASGRVVLVLSPDPRGGADDRSLLRTRHLYDEAGRLCRVVVDAAVDPSTLDDPCTGPWPGRDDLVTTITRDPSGAITTIAEPDGTIARRELDRLGRLVRLETAGGRIDLTYDEAGHVIRRVDTTDDGTLEVRWTYDAAGRPVRRQAGDDITTYRYGPDEHLVGVRGPSGEITIERDLLGRPLLVIAEDGATTRWTYGPDAVTRTDPSGTYRMALDADGAVTSLVTPLSEEPFRYRLTPEGEVAAIVAPSGAETRLHRDGPGALIGIDWSDAAGAPVGGIDLVRDAAGRIEREDSRIAGDPATGVMRVTHDVHGRVVEADGPLPPGYGLPRPSAPVMWPKAGDDTTDHQSACAGGGGLRLECDALGRPVEVRSAAGLLLARYTYDALDRVASATHGERVTRFRYVGLSDSIAGLSDGEGTTVLDVISGPDGAAIGDRDPVSDRARLYGRNASGDIVLVTDEDGRPLATLRYDPWGNTVAASGTDLPPLRAGGAFYDPSTGLAWRDGRWYAPALGIFLATPIDSTQDGAGPTRPQEGIR